MIRGAWPEDDDSVAAADHEIAEELGLSTDLVRLSRVVEPAGECTRLEQALYRLYRRRGVDPRERVDPEADAELVRALSRANTGRGTWEPDWTIERAGDAGSVAVRREGVVYFSDARRVRVDPDPGPGSGPPASGASCRVFVPEERQRLHPGSYVALGDADLAPARELCCLVRVYWHLRVSSAVPWLRRLTSELNRRRVPFRLKVAASTRRFDSADSGVLYLEPVAVESAWPVIAEAYAEHAGQMRSSRPLMTFPLAPGLGLAEGPADGSSFGRDRVARIAAALIGPDDLIEDDRVEEGRASSAALASRCRAVAASFAGAGLEPRRPYLAPGSPDRWRPLQASERGPSRGRRRAGRARPERRAEVSDPAARAPAASSTAIGPLLAEAVRIGDHLCAEVFWDGGRCNWTGRDPGDVCAPGTARAKVTALGFDVYQGSAGPGLFLAELSTVTGERRHRQTAAAALQRSLDVIVAEIEAGIRPGIIAGLERDRIQRAAGGAGGVASGALPGFLAGPLGALAAALRGGRLIDDERLTSRSRVLLATVLAGFGESLDGERLGTLRLDLLGGVAGIVVGLIELAPGLPGAACLEIADRLGSELISSAETRGEIWSWPNLLVSGVAPARPPLAGLSHGASGIALALLDLHSATRDARFLEAARGALAYEQTLFDPAEGNWLDLRPPLSGEAGPAPRFSVAWCHGAPGIALARLRAVAVDPEQRSRHREQATIALERTRREAELRSVELLDASLCHGLGGLLDVLLCGADALDEPRLEAAAREAATAALASNRRRGWPSGVPSGGPNPSLFLGQAGVGHVLLRLATGGEQRPPSLLLGGIPA
ncbi:MAG TPA: lanthionine synthetase LanC family protein [Thermoanaerobaculia bacterium]|nr:lanthionine synthetase LanC family protein [Thermoanaerobaculia bacterium]